MFSLNFVLELERDGEREGERERARERDTYTARELETGCGVIVSSYSPKRPGSLSRRLGLVCAGATRQRVVLTQSALFGLTEIVIISNWRVSRDFRSRTQ